MAKKIPDTTIVLFDVGHNTTENDESTSQTFYEQAKNCLEAILMRKIFNRPTDEFALYLFGSKVTHNSLNTENPGEYNNISQVFEMEPIKWEMLKTVQSGIEQPNEDITGDWMDALIVAMDYFTNLGLEKCTKKILLFTTFSTEVNGSSVGAVIRGLNELGIELIVVTKNVTNVSDKENQAETVTFSQSTDKDHIKEKSEALIMDIVKESDGSMCSLDEAVAKLLYVDKKQRRRMPWNCDLTFGETLTIKIAAYIYLEDKNDLAIWKARTATGEPVKSEIENYHNDTLVDPETVATELVKGYMYGGVAVPFEDVAFDNGNKGLRCIGFTDIANIGIENLEGSSIRMVIPQKGYDSSAKRFSALLAAMRKLNLALVSRYTYNNTSAPKVMALFPHDNNSMLMHELFYTDNMVKMDFPPLDSRKSQPSDEQYKFMDEFIDSMDLTKDSKWQQFDQLMDPGLQHMYRVLAYRATHPNDPVPTIDKDLLALITPPKPNGIDIEDMKKLFPLTAIKLSTKEKLLRNIQDIRNQVVDQDELKAELSAKHDTEITKIGTIRPAEDFTLLLAMGQRFDDLIVELQDRIVQLATKSMVAMDDKIHQALFAYREVAKQKGPYKYNGWIVNFKELLKERENVQLFELIVNEGLGLITARESEISTVSDEEAATFYKADDFYTQNNQNTDVNMADDDDLFGEM